MNLRVVLPRGTPYSSSIDLLGRAGLPVERLRRESRRLVFELEDGTTIITARPSDVPVYVEFGAADVGFAGKDVLLEQDPDLYELLDLRIAPCRLIYATLQRATARRGERTGRLRIATKYPRAARGWFEAQGRQVDIIELKGSIELAPQVGLADGIVDLTSSGVTLRKNGLVERAEIARCSTRLVANRAAHKLRGDEVADLVERLRVARIVPEGDRAAGDRS
jgi:ATP phosphoribosyltransferase